MELPIKMIVCNPGYVRRLIVTMSGYQRFSMHSTCSEKSPVRFADPGFRSKVETGLIMLVMVVNTVLFGEKSIALSLFWVVSETVGSARLCVFGLPEDRRKRLNCGAVGTGELVQLSLDPTESHFLPRAYLDSPSLLAREQRVLY